MKHGIVLIGALAVTCAVSGNVKNLVTKKPSVKGADMSQSIYEHFGEDLRDTRKQKGKVVFVNAQKTAKSAWLSSVAERMTEDLHIAVEVAEGTFNAKSPAVLGNATVYIVDDAGLPPSLVAPESRWATVNVAPLKTDKVKFFEMRVRKAVARTFAILCGASASQFPNNLMEPVFSPSQYDKYVNEALPFDVMLRLSGSVRAFGIEPFRVSNYLEACQEGWAPAPTNDVQKAIWDKVHTIPKNPMKIEFDPKKGR